MLYALCFLLQPQGTWYTAPKPTSFFLRRETNAERSSMLTYHPAYRYFCTIYIHIYVHTCNAGHQDKQDQSVKTIKPKRVRKTPTCPRAIRSSGWV